MPRLLPPARRRTPARSRASRPLAAVALGLTLALSGCSGDDPGSADRATAGDPTASASEPASPTSLAAPSSSAPPSSAPAQPQEPKSPEEPEDPEEPPADQSTAVPPSPPAADGTVLGRRLAGSAGRPPVDRHLLPADRLPMLGTGTAWQASGTGAEGNRGVGICQKTDLGAIGAVTSVVRRYTHPSGARAAQVVAAFPDGRSTWRARQVLLSWRADCQERVQLADPKVGPLTPVPVSRGLGSHYRTAHGAARRDERVVAGLAILRKGRRLALVEVTAPSAAYPGGTSPARVALRRVARMFR